MFSFTRKTQNSTCRTLVYLTYFDIRHPIANIFIHRSSAIKVFCKFKCRRVLFETRGAALGRKRVVGKNHGEKK